MIQHILLIFYLLHATTCDEVYQNSSHICNKCKCVDDDEFIMDCSNQQFQHVLANWPAHNKSLVATFSYNNITTLERLPITEHKAKLVFDHCNIQYLDSGVFSNMKNVEFIDLSYNLLTAEEIGGDDFRGPYDNKKYRPIAVKYLNLAYNKIHSLPKKFFENMPDLEDLNLQGNDFVVLDPTTQTALASLKKIKVLNLADNELTELEGALINNLHSLIELDLSYNKLDFVPMQLSSISKNLQILKLSANFIFKLTDQSFLGLDLTELYLNNLDKLKVVEANTFATLKRLKKLQLKDNENLKVIDREAFGPNQTLDELDISNNSLTDINYSLLNWSQLKIFRMDSNPLECSCDLYNISQALSKSIIRNLERPTCTFEDVSFRVYNMDPKICSEDATEISELVTDHFNNLIIAMIVLSTLLISATVLTAIIAVLRYRKAAALRNYQFTSCVNYYPIQTEHI